MKTGTSIRRLPSGRFSARVPASSGRVDGVGVFDTWQEAVEAAEAGRNLHGHKGAEKRPFGEDWPTQWRDESGPRQQLPLVEQGPWMDRAACKGVDTEVFYPEGGGNHITLYTEAAKVCKRCPVVTECLESIWERETKDPTAIWGYIGGMTPPQRRALYRATATR